MILDRFKNKNIEYSTIRITFPNEEHIVDENNRIWTGTNSCFKFDKLENNESNQIIMNIPTVQQTNTFSITDDKFPTISFKCILDGYVNSSNDFEMKFKENKNYNSFIDYNDEINNLFNEHLDLSGSIALIDDSNVSNFNINVHKVISNDMFNIAISDNWDDTNDSITFETTDYGFKYVIPIDRKITINKNDILITITSKYDSDVSYNIIYNNDDVYNDGVYNDDFATILQNSIRNFTHEGHSIFADSTVSSTPFDNGPTRYYNIEAYIIMKLNANHFSINFNDQNVVSIAETSWFDYLNLSDAMIGLSDAMILKYLNLNDDSNDFLSMDTSFNIATIKGTKPLISNKLDIIQGQNDTINIVAYGDGVKTFESYDNDIIITISPAEYTRDELIVEINSQINTLIRDDSTLTKIRTKSDDSYFKIITRENDNINSYLMIDMNIQRKYTTSDFNVVFYDKLSFSSCFVGVSSIHNSKWDTTIGWTLGFRTYTVYNLTDDGIINNNSIKILGDTSATNVLYKHFIICLDDYNQNHLNDGLVTITNVDKVIALPSYAIRSELKCNPVTGELEYDNNTLTNNQLETIAQIANSKNNKNSIGESIPSDSYGNGPFVKDTFGLMPFKSGVKFGDLHSEYGGTLQNQERRYFGPVNINRMSVKLVSDKGDVVNLNNANWSFAIICEQLNHNIDKSKK